MTKIEILTECLNMMDRDYILFKADYNDETPFGFVLGYIKDEYNLPKPDGWNIANAILAFFNIANDFVLARG